MGMKNLVLIMVFVLIITVFIAFNYLLWDRENFEDINASKNAAIDAFSVQIKNLEERNKILNNNVDNLQEDINELKVQNELLTKSVENKDGKINTLTNELKNKDQFIQVLKQQIDLIPLKNVINEWAEEINNGNYEAAYEKQYRKEKEDNKITVEEFAAVYKDIIKSITVKSIELMIKGPSINKVDNCIVLKVVLDIKKIEEKKGQYYDGVNIRYFIMNFNEDTNSWNIKDISYYY